MRATMLHDYCVEDDPFTVVGLYDVSKRESVSVIRNKAKRDPTSWDH
jgi:hypothetical protein